MALSLARLTICLDAGIFTGQLKRDDEVEKGSRFDPNTAQGKNYRTRYCASAVLSPSLEASYETPL